MNANPAVPLPTSKREAVAELTRQRNAPVLESQQAGPVQTGEAEAGAGNPATRRALQVDPFEYRGGRYTEYPPAFDWLLDLSLRRRCLGVIGGPPGSGKGFFSVQMALAVASGEPFLDIWPVSDSGPVIYLSAEDDESTIHRRFYHALEKLPASCSEKAAENFYGIPVHGDVQLFSGNNNLIDLRELIGSVHPKLVILDTYARFSAIPEIENDRAQAFCGLLEEIIHNYKCNIICLHHTNKDAGNCVDGDGELKKALSQTALRGASALAGCARWVLLMAQLGSDFAGNKIECAGGEASGSFVAVRVAKKNAGFPERIHFLGRDENGLLYQVKGKDEEAGPDVVEDAHTLAEEVQRREASGEPALSVSRCGLSAFGWSVRRTKKAVERGLELKLFGRVKAKQGEKLCSAVPPCSAQAGTMD
jgi:hypothetical protein